MYEFSAATHLLATYCACCSRPLVDAVSAETGMGPVCRKKHGYYSEGGEANWEAAEAAIEETTYAYLIKTAAWNYDARGVANHLIFCVACDQKGTAVASATVALRALGFESVAARIAKRLISVNVTHEGDSLVVECGFNPRFNEAIRAAKGARWDAERKVRLVPMSQRLALWQAIKASFAPGTLVIGETKTTVLSAD